jgi:hypothetical protein
VNSSGLISFPATDSGTINSHPLASTNSYYNLTGGLYPTIADASASGYVPNLYSAGSFEFVPVPEPGPFVALIGMCTLGSIGFALRRNR